MPRGKKRPDLVIDPDLVVIHKPKISRAHVGTEYAEDRKESGSSDPQGKICHSYPCDNRELVRHLFPHLQDRVLMPTKKESMNGRSQSYSRTAQATT